MSEEFCHCPETYMTIDGQTIHLPKPHWHDCDYIRERSKLTAEACRLADAHSPSPIGWGAVFTRVMEELVKERMK